MANGTFFSRLGAATQSLIGSRFFVSLAGACLAAFGAHALAAPYRFPPLMPLNPTLWGLAPTTGPVLEGQAASLANEAVRHATPHAPGFVKAAFEAWTMGLFGGDADAAIAVLNYLATALSACALIAGMILLARKRIL